MLPTDQQIKTLHRKYARTDDDFNLIYEHCQIVEAIAMQLLDAKPIRGIDKNLVQVGCLLHDIGAYEVLVNGKFVEGVRHGFVGEDILRKEGFDDAIARLASHHTGVGLTRQDIIENNIAIPAADYLAETNEERLIMYADKFHSKSNPPSEPPYFCSYEWFRDSIQKFGVGKAIKFDELAEFFGIPDLHSLSRQYEYEIRDK